MFLIGIDIGKRNHEAAKSFGISIATDVFKLEVHIMLEQIKLLESQIEIVEEEMYELISKQDNYLTTITGIGDITVAVIMAEVGDTNRFERPNQTSCMCWFRCFC
ncbi:transposase [Listeria monocytogenes]|nr:transposase [Listeria monocytogenes]